MLLRMRPPPSLTAAADITISSLFVRRKAETESGKFGDGKNTHVHRTRPVLTAPHMHRNESYFTHSVVGSEK